MFTTLSRDMNKITMNGVKSLKQIAQLNMIFFKIITVFGFPTCSIVGGEYFVSIGTTTRILNMSE